nr:UvrD-helicase domain-containing protein [Adhaeribacter radiodurans]
MEKVRKGGTNLLYYEFLQTITALAGEVRVIVVGDDDQNIYEFRGSSVAFMRNFQREWQAKAYF